MWEFLTNPVFANAVAAITSFTAVASSIIAYLSYRKMQVAEGDIESVRGQLKVARDANVHQREKWEADIDRLKLVDPERFLDQADSLYREPDFEALEELALSFTEAQSEAFGRAAEILTEQRIVDCEIFGAGPLEEAERFADIGLAAHPGSVRLLELRNEASEMRAALDRGEPLETVDWTAETDVEFNRLAIALQKEGRYRLAEIAARRSVPLAFVRTGGQSSNYAAAIGQHALTLNNIGAYSEAEPLYREALEITRTALGEAHPDYAQSLNNLAALLKTTGRPEEAEPLYREALEIRRTALGEAHPDYAQSLNNLALLLADTGRPEEAEPLYREALKITRTALGEAHPDYARSLNNLATLLDATGRFEEAEPLCREAVSVAEAALGAEHPTSKHLRNNLETLLAKRSD